MANDPILIVGAGIGGLSLAAGLSRAGLPFRLFERAPALGEVGAGLGLWTNAIRALETLGVPRAALADRAYDVRIGEAGTAAGDVLARFDVAKLAEEYGAPSYVVHRGELHATLAAAVDGAAITLDAEAVDLTQDDDGVTLRFADGSDARGALVIGADGLWSSVRAALFGDAPARYSGETCYRGVAAHELAPEERHVLREVQGHGLRCCVTSLGPGRVYWWATERRPAGDEVPIAERKAHLAERFAGFAFGFPAALEATPADAILQNDLYDRPPIPTWSRGRATLLGDAAHPTTPNLGQGACMAIEDAVVLTRCLAHRGVDDPAAAFEAYEEERRARCYGIVAQSRTFGRVGSWSNPLAVGLRNLVNRATPGWLLEKAMRRQLGYDAGPLA